MSMRSEEESAGSGIRATRLYLPVLVFAVAASAGCVATMPTAGGGSGTAVTGAAGGATAENANSSLERCDESLGTLGIVEDQGATWYRYLANYKLGSTVPVLRLMVQQSNCFVIVERGAAMQHVSMERELQRSGEMRSGSNMGPGQMVAADYTMSPSITFSENTGGMGGGLFGLSGRLGILGAVAGGLKSNEASTTLIMIDNRSGVQLAAAEGSAQNTDFNLFGTAFGWAGGAGAGGYSKTPEGKVIIAAFTDSYNQLVRAVRNYRAQTVRGGLGTGGALGVQGGTTPASLKAEPAVAPAPASKPATPPATRKSTTRKK